MDDLGGDEERVNKKIRHLSSAGFKKYNRQCEQRETIC
jgi:hypothetical protein